MSSKAIDYQTLIDKTVLDHNVNQIQVGSDVFNVQIRLSDTRLINLAFEEMLALPQWDDNQKIHSVINNNGQLATPAKVVRGTHPALHYRGNALKRHKIWFQKEAGHFYVYKYTGWQKRVMNATFRVTEEQYPALWNLVHDLETSTGLPQNHWIMTLYEDGLDYIGMHSDKTKTWRAGSSFVVQKWGHPRLFQIALQDHEDVDKCTIIFNKILPAGTKVLVDSETNLKTRHGVPIMDPKTYGTIGASGSIVGRDIETEVTFSEAAKMIARAERDAARRKEKKKRKQEKQGGNKGKKGKQ